MKIFKLTYYHTLMLLRDKQNIIMLVFFPSLILALLGKSFFEYIQYDTSLNLAIYLLPGIIVMAILNTCVFSIGSELSILSEKDILNRLFLSPLKKSSFFLAYVVSRMILIAIELVILFSTGYFLFHINLWSIDLLSCYMAVILGIIVCTLLGFFAFGVASSSNSVVALCNSITMPMLFVSGSFFPLENNAFLYTVSLFMPIEPLVKIFQSIFLKKESIFSLGDHLLKLIIIILVLGAIDIYILTKRKKI